MRDSPDCRGSGGTVKHKCSIHSGHGGPSQTRASRWKESRERPKMCLGAWPGTPSPYHWPGEIRLWDGSMIRIGPLLSPSVPSPHAFRQVRGSQHLSPGHVSILPSWRPGGSGWRADWANAQGAANTSADTRGSSPDRRRRAFFMIHPSLFDPSIWRITDLERAGR